ncbi:GBP6-like protein, partial [Mya arenaria]
MSQNESPVDSSACRDVRSKVGLFESMKTAETTKKSDFEDRRSFKPNEGYKPKKRLSSPTPSTKTKHCVEKKLAERLESGPNDKNEYWSEHDLEVFKKPLCLVSAGKKNVLHVEQDVLEQLHKIDLPCGDPSHDNRIFTLATLLCSTLVYNMKGAFDQDAIAKNIRFGGRCDENNSMLQCILPGFVLVLRDFSLKMIIGNKKITTDEYLETSLENEEELGPDFNKPREAIKKFFPSDKRKCFALPVPGDGDILENLEQLTFKDLSKRFQDEISKFLEFMFNVEPKQLVVSKPVTGSMLAVLTNQYVDALRNGAVPDVENAFEAVATMENAKVRKEALEQFHKDLVDQIMPVPYKQLDDHFQRVQWTALEYIRNNVVKDTKHSVEKHVQSDMEMSWLQRKSVNEQHVIELCEKSLEALPSTSKLVESIQAKSYAVVGGHKQFKLDSELVGKQYHSMLKDKGYTDREMAITWSTFIQTLAEAEMEIIQLDNSLSEEEKKKQRKTYTAQQKKIEDERDKQDRQHQEKMTNLIQKIADLETDKDE